jgi:hypothetical protein
MYKPDVVDLALPCAVSCTAAPTRQPGAPHSPTQSTQEGSRRIGTGAARGQGGRVVARTPRRRRRQRPTTLTSAPSCRLKYDHVIKMVILLVAARQFSPPGAANSQFWLRICTYKLSPRATTSPKPEGHGIIIANYISQGSILMNKLLGRMGEGGKFRFSLRFSLRFLLLLFLGSSLVRTEFLEYFDRYDSDFKKKHAELFFIFIYHKAFPMQSW